MTAVPVAVTQMGALGAQEGAANVTVGGVADAAYEPRPLLLMTTAASPMRAAFSIASARTSQALLRFGPQS